MNHLFKAREQELCILKFGSSVLETESDYPSAALEIYRHLRKGEKVVAVVSALAGETDALLNQAERVGGTPPQALVARLARVGELQSAALMALALSRIGVRAYTLDPHEMGLMAQGDPLDSDLVELDAEAVLVKFGEHDVVVVPGFTAGHKEHGIVTLGRGGTDLSAVFFAARLGARRARLIKDVDGVYTEDPAKNPLAERYSELNYEEAAEASAGLIQPKAIHAAAEAGVVIEIAAIGAGEATAITRGPARASRPAKPKPLRVALLGCGAVGTGVLAFLQARPDLFQVNPVLVRDPACRGEEGRFTDRLAQALAEKPDMVVELIGGADYPADIMCSALRSGAHVVTANKAAIAKHYDSLHACAEAGGASFAYSAAVGGGAPVIETIRRLKGRVAAVEGVMNGTANFLLGKLGEGWVFDDALRKARELGFAEADPAADVDGHDAADKLSILIREGLGMAFPRDRIALESLRDVTPEMAQAAWERGEILKQVGRFALLQDGGLSVEIRIESLCRDHRLAGVRDEENCFLLRDSEEIVHEVRGKGAGRWPSAASVFADIMDIQRAISRRVDEPASPGRLLLRA